MTYRRLVLIGCLLLAGCASMPVKSGLLVCTVTPSVLHPGDVVKIKVEAPEGTRDMQGSLDVPGSPKLPLKTKDGGKTWTFTTQIPVDAVWKPGRYRALARGIAPDGTVLVGETWITAP
jgi:hypothetical protein